MSPIPYPGFDPSALKLSPVPQAPVLPEVRSEWEGSFHCVQPQVGGFRSKNEQLVVVLQSVALAQRHIGYITPRYWRIYRRMGGYVCSIICRYGKWGAICLYCSRCSASLDISSCRCISCCCPGRPLTDCPLYLLVGNAQRADFRSGCQFFFVPLSKETVGYESLQSEVTLGH